MTDTNGALRVAVLGGGILGVSTAVQMLRGGAAVVLVTEAGIASGASGRSLAWLNSAGPKSEAYHRLRLAGLDRYRTLLAQNPGIGWLGFGGGLYWASAADEADTRERHDTEVAHGYDSRLLPQDTAVNVLPGIDPAVAPEAVTGPVVHNPGEGWVSLPHLVQHLMQEFTARGGELVAGAGKAAVVLADGRAAGLRLADGRGIAADAVLVAAGADTPAVVRPLGVDLPDASDLALLVITEPVETSLATVLNTPRVSVRPHPGNRLAMDSSWYLDRITRNADGSYAIDPAVVQELIGEASKVLAGQPELRAAEHLAGRKPIPGDGEPVLGELPTVPGCFVAFTHSGATLGLIAGELLAGEILTGRRHPLLAGFRAERFS
ncbi:NAD(P)/FAD-dependent oxidoreductase [Arthrobacter sp. zg-Y750]|uniref:NAD(P)/FAD-dependent oxidoreductase n=1 Tax=Arthrobacter sp. zg-Y750 TaxID=2894189 RepID=UPI001E5084F8|nr:FAD-binding oxidoreductase [Arthrobacter sp. zg-Y750]MCC9178289.1 FAD-binding oxidoreductase [Arthrobacter sp. zg-Y750]